MRPSLLTACPYCCPPDVSGTALWQHCSRSPKVWVTWLAVVALGGAVAIVLSELGWSVPESFRGGGLGRPSLCPLPCSRPWRLRFPGDFVCPCFLLSVLDQPFLLVNSEKLVTAGQGGCFFKVVQDNTQVTFDVEVLLLVRMCMRSGRAVGTDLT